VGATTIVLSCPRRLAVKGRVIEAKARQDVEHAHHPHSASALAAPASTTAPRKRSARQRIRSRYLIFDARTCSWCSGATPGPSP
jgi:hypothetical protein